jgi:uncharacterized protein YkwD
MNIGTPLRLHDCVPGAVARVLATFVGVAAAASCAQSPAGTTAHLRAPTVEETTTTATTVVSTSVASTSVAPTTVLSTTAVSTTEAPTTAAPTTETTANEAPTTEVPTTEATAPDAPPPDDLPAEPPTTEAPAAEFSPPGASLSFAVASSSTAAEFFELTNATRASIGVGALRYSSDLEAYAQNWAQVMADAGTISHSNIANLLDSWYSVGENVGVGPTARVIDAALRASPPHYENISYSGFTAMGVGVATDASSRIYTTHVFAS